MKTILIALFLLLPEVAFAAHTTVNLTPENVEKYDLNVSIKAIPQTIKVGDKPTRVTGYAYQIKVASEKVNLKNLHLALSVKAGEDSYLHAALPSSPYTLKHHFIFFAVTFSHDYLDKTYVTFDDLTDGSSFSYRLKIKDWLKTSKQADSADKR